MLDFYKQSDFGLEICSNLTDNLWFPLTLIYAEFSSRQSICKFKTIEFVKNVFVTERGLTVILFLYNVN